MVLKVAMVFLVVLMVSVVCYARPFDERLNRWPYIPHVYPEDFRHNRHILRHPPYTNYSHQRYRRGAESSSSESSSSDSSDEDNAPPPPPSRPVYRPPWHDRYHWETPARPSPAVYVHRPTSRWSVYRPVYRTSPAPAPAPAPTTTDLSEPTTSGLPAPTTTDLPNSVADYATDVEETDSHSQSLSNGQQEINSNDVNAPIPYRIRQ